MTSHLTCKALDDKHQFVKNNSQLPNSTSCTLKQQTALTWRKTVFPLTQRQIVFSHDDIKCRYQIVINKSQFCPSYDKKASCQFPLTMTLAASTEMWWESQLDNFFMHHEVTNSLDMELSCFPMKNNFSLAMRLDANINLWSTITIVQFYYITPDIEQASLLIAQDASQHQREDNPNHIAQF